MAETQTPKAEKPTYHRDRLIAEADDFTGHPSHVVQAALDHVKGNKTHFTRDEAEKAVKDYLDHPAEMSYGEFTGIPGVDSATEEGS